MPPKARKRALVGGGKKKKAVSGRETKKGVKGVASNYIHRTRAVRRLQVSLRDFRRLCILKGIYPRDPKKKPNGKDKTYYHVKDIKFLMHEPLLQKFRDMKIFLKRHKKAMIKREFNTAKTLERTMKPQINLDHLVKERYPTFVDAVRDLDDPLSMISLYSLLPGKTCGEHRMEMSAECTQLTREFEHWVIRSKSLRKVFVSIKGFYYQAQVYGQDVTWLVPHKFKQSTPKNVDFRVMVTFLQFYTTLVRFVNYKLYYDLGLRYPPILDEKKEDEGAYLAALKVEGREEKKTETGERGSTADESEEDISLEQQQKTQAMVAQVVEKLEQEDKSEKPMDVIHDTNEDEGVNEGDEDDNEMDKAVSTTQEVEANEAKELDKMQKQIQEDEGDSVCIFNGLVFLIGREVPQDSLEFVILAGGGVVLREGQISRDEAMSEKITHQIVDRPSQKYKLFTREYAQPQWVYDSFNTRTLLPIEHYAPGATLPPHLSPFVHDEREGYIPKQKEILRSWGGQVGGEVPEEGDVIVEKKADSKEITEENMAKIMMTNKTKRLYDKMMHGIARKEAVVENLRSKRQRLESEQKGDAED